MSKYRSLILLLSLILAVLAQEVQGVSGAREKRQKKGCHPRKDWTCANRHCIDRDHLCDGIPHCSDGSDETAAACGQIDCPAFALRCGYGACVSPEAKCNGRNDCADGSDEVDCATGGQQPQENGTEVAEECSQFFVKCGSGECIDDDFVCDGKADCGDASDEEHCEKAFCPEFAFRCHYGACIGGSKECDGVKDCLDGSDEHPKICKKHKPHEVATQAPTRATSTTRRPVVVGPGPGPTPGPVSTTTTTTTPSPILTEYVPGSCQVPASPENGFIYLDQQNKSGRVNLPEDSYVASFASVSVGCQPPYKVDTRKNSIYCTDGFWTDEFPTCQRFCSEVNINRLSLDPHCFLKGERVTCRGFDLVQGVEVRLKCAIGYRKPDDPTLVDVLHCGEDGEWDSHPFRCQQECGTITSHGTGLIVGGRQAAITEAPWHVAIYRRFGDRYSQICGGSIIHPRLVVSAAHCFWSREKAAIESPDLYKIAAGKALRDYNDDEGMNSEKFDIQEFVYTVSYQDYTGYYNLDFIVAVLKTFIQFKPHIKPVCFERSLEQNEKFVTSNIPGRVVGWGKTQSGGNSSAVLKLIELNTVDYFTCKTNSPTEFRNFVTQDKFCAGDTQNQLGVCDGDSGGGFVTNRTIGSDQVFFLKGIVSSGPSKLGSCNPAELTTFTNAHHYEHLITEAESHFSRSLL